LTNAGAGAVAVGDFAQTDAVQIPGRKSM
jgi:hypothetical protein